MSFLINKLASLVEPYVMPIVERNVVPDAIVRFGELLASEHVAVVDRSS